MSATITDQMWENSILIVDDDEDIRKQMIETLESIASDIFEASSGSEALDIMREKKVDLLLTDIRMPDLDGLQLSEIAKKENLAEATIIITGFGERDELLQALNQSGVDHIIDKPIEDDILSKITSDHLLTVNRRKIWKASENLVNNYLGIITKESPEIADDVKIIQGKSEELDPSLQKLAYIRQRARAEQSEMRKNHFMDNISHDLRTPLNAIIGYSELILENVQSGDLSSLKEDLKKIVHSGKLAHSIIDGLMGIRKSDTCPVILNHKKTKLVDLKDFCESIVNLKNISELVTFKHVCTDTDEFIIDELRLKQVLLYLTNCTLRFSRDKTSSLCIRLKTMDKKYLELEGICRNGHVSNILLEAAFMPYDVHKECFDAGEGTSFELTLIKSLVESMGGEFSIVNTSPHQSAFTVSVPEASESHPNTPNIRILVLNGHTLSDLLNSLVSREGYDVVYSKYDNEPKESFDIVILFDNSQDLLDENIIINLKKKSLTTPLVLSSPTSPSWPLIEKMRLTKVLKGPLLMEELIRVISEAVTSIEKSNA